MSPDWVERVRGDPSRTSEAEKAEDETLRRAVRTARAWGAPFSAFLGRKVVTTYEHDAAGRVVRAVTEAAWTDEDQDIAVALADYEVGLCGGCRDELRLTTLPEREFAYIPGPPIRCHRCTASLLASERYEDHPQSGALLIPIELKTPT